MGVIIAGDGAIGAATAHRLAARGAEVAPRGHLVTFATDRVVPPGAQLPEAEDGPPLIGAVPGLPGVTAAAGAA